MVYLCNLGCDSESRALVEKSFSILLESKNYNDRGSVNPLIRHDPELHLWGNRNCIFGGTEPPLR